MSKLINIYEYPVNDVLDTLLRDYTTDQNILLYEKKPLTYFEAVWSCPRVNKNVASQAERTRKKAEVFTPTWIIRKMVDCIDDNFSFSGDWQSYVDARCLEITCGEAPFLANRYDAATGEEIVITERTGILDRKLRLVGENTAHNRGEWFEGAKRALQSVYGYEFQGDSLLIARINLLVTFVDYMEYYCGVMPTQEQLMEVAEIIARNLWQMDGLTGAIPYATPTEAQLSFSFSGDCETSSDCKIWEWDSGKEYLWRDVEGGQGMKFDFVIGNPPYQEETDSDSTRKPPIYNLFMEEAYKVGDKVELITPARFLFNAGYTPKSWNEKMLSDEHFKILYYEPKSDKIFPNTEIKGGVAITYRDVKKKFEAIGTFTKYSELNNILQKVKRITNKYMESIIFSPLSYQLTDKMKIDFPNLTDRLRSSAFTNLSEIFIENKPKDGKEYISMIGLLNNQRVIRYVRRDYIKDNSGTLDAYTLLMPKASGSGVFGEQTGTTVIAEPGLGYTQTFIGIGKFETRLEAENVQKYTKTKFLRAMLGVLKITQDLPAPKWKWIPLQNFTNESDIDWRVSIADIDRQLYKKYELTPEEIDFIETHVKEMT